MAVIAATGDVPPEDAVRTAARVLADGGVVGLPTDTVYGLAADPFRPGGTDRIFRAKRRPRRVPLPVLVADEEQVLALAASVPDVARRLMERHWPGALTVVLSRRPGLGADLGDDLGTGQATVGVRCPAHPVPIAVCRAAGPLATTSANLHGEASLTRATEVGRAFGDAVPVVLDGGTCAGAPSTVVDCTGAEPRLLRQGGVSWEEVLAAAG